MKATEIDNFTINKTHCDWIIKQAQELKTLLSYKSESMVVNNKTRALTDIQTMEDSLSELKLYIEQLK